MPIQRLIEGKKRVVEAFLRDETAVLLHIGVDSEAKAMLLKLLFAIDSEPDNLNIFFGFDHAFEEAAGFYQSAFEVVAQECAQARLEYLGGGFDVPVLKLAATRSIEPEFARNVRELAEALSSRCDALVLVFGLRENAANPEYTGSLHLLAEQLRGSLVKLVVVGPRGKSPFSTTDETEDHLRAMEFHISPEAIEQGVRDKLKEKLPDLERMRYLTALAGFAMARKEFPVALQLGKQCLRTSIKRVTFAKKRSRHLI